MGTTQRPSKAKWKKASWSEFAKAFNEKHNPNLNTSVGVVSVESKNKYK